VIVRVVGDLVDVLGRWRGWGGLLNAGALLLFMSTRAVRWSREECVANPSEMPGATTVAPLTLTAYQEGAVVSRILRLVSSR
jgi:hypothetical protein